VLEPPELRRIIAKHAASLVEKYGDEPL